MKKGDEKVYEPLCIMPPKLKEYKNILVRQ